MIECAASAQPDAAVQAAGCMTVQPLPHNTTITLGSGQRQKIRSWEEKDKNTQAHQLVGSSEQDAAAHARAQGGASKGGGRHGRGAA